MIHYYFLMPYNLNANGILDAWMGTKCQEPATSYLSIFGVQDNKHIQGLCRTVCWWLFSKKPFGHLTRVSKTGVWETLIKQCTGVPELLIFARAVLSESAAKHWFSAELLIFWECSIKHRIHHWPQAHYTGPLRREITWMPEGAGQQHTLTAACSPHWHHQHHWQEQGHSSLSAEHCLI